jgi:phosphotransferase system HPr (HPr) family protein
MTMHQNGLTQTVRIRNELGLHARSAAIIARIAQRATAAVWIMKGNEKADASSVIDLLTLECPKGTLITITIVNPLDHTLLNEIAAQVEAGFGE